jgi:acyl-CoA synthetase (AMP-forming)/AMP-acid ligase II
MRSALKRRLRVARGLWRAGILRPMRPDKLARSLTVLRQWGLSPAASYALAAIRHPERAAIVDDLGTLTFAEVQGRTNALARALRASGVCEGETVAIMCRNHRWFIEATVACSKLGAAVAYLDTTLEHWQVTEAIMSADPVAVIYDEDFAELILDGSVGRARFIAWSDLDQAERPFLLEELIAGAEDREPAPPKQRAPVGSIASAAHGDAQLSSRSAQSSLMSPAPRLAELPLRAGQTTVLAAPMCHSWGFVQMKLGLRLGSTLVLRHAFDAEQTLDDVAHHKASALAVLPEMLGSIVEVPHEATATHRTACLRVVAVNGATVPGRLAIPAIKAFGTVLYNLYGPPVVQLGEYLGRERRAAVRVHAGIREHSRSEPHRDGYVARRARRG